MASKSFKAAVQRLKSPALAWLYRAASGETLSRFDYLSLKFGFVEVLGINRD